MDHPTGSRILIEVCVGSVESALNAARGGAGRLELCANLGLGGGTTPSLGLLKSVQRALEDNGFDMPIMVMIRSRVGDFVYTDYELEVMIQDIQSFKENGATGMVFGVLTADGRIDCERTRRLVEASSQLDVCFHRAFDMTRDPLEAYKDVASIGGITRILTSGQKSTVLDSLDVLKSLSATNRHSSSDKAPSILPGSGINAGTVETVVRELDPTEIHLSGGGWVEGQMEFRRKGMSMGVSSDNDWSIWRTDEATIREVRNKVDTMRGL
ncbi:hypothetical protein L218DRAFT_48753 [Marasmius fiardii PR-910]|nr:hypothetical protein L218DRAFT_48753 [Marasmius fiardii PR-910]